MCDNVAAYDTTLTDPANPLWLKLHTRLLLPTRSSLNLGSAVVQQIVASLAT
jgi:hypothetical protein